MPIQGGGRTTNHVTTGYDPNGRKASKVTRTTKRSSKRGGRK